tara:strand:- start:554 stop:1909 length:1356 start_codon:yes stop_codon:yes gene_type:complete
MAHTQLSRTPSGAGNRKTFTISVWVKRSELGTENLLLKIDGGTNNTNYIEMKFDSGDRLLMGGYTSNFLRTNRLFRDPSAWYHIVWRVDTTQSTADDRVRLYVNGVQQTSFGQRNNPGQNDDMAVNNTTSTILGSTLDGYLAQYIIADGQSYAPTVFGSTNANGIWIPNSSPSVTYGTNGFKLDFAGTGASADASGFGADSSGNGNHFASSNLGTNPSTTDQCINNFVTLNPLQNGYPPTGNVVTLSQGNLTAKETQSAWTPYDSTIAATAGKWYWECKNVSGSPATGVMFGIQSQEGSDITGIFSTDGRYPGYYSGRVGFSYHASGTYYYNGTGTTSGSVSYTTGDIIMFALDMENGFLYAGKNGSWNNSGDPTSGASGTGNVYNGFSGKPISPCNALNGSTILTSMNFGNPPFTIASSNADANGYGNFEYAVPSGYYALCTKNLAAYGG